MLNWLWWVVDGWDFAGKWCWQQLKSLKRLKCESGNWEAFIAGREECIKSCQYKDSVFLNSQHTQSIYTVNTHSRHTQLTHTVDRVNTFTHSIQSVQSTWLELAPLRHGVENWAHSVNRPNHCMMTSVQSYNTTNISICTTPDLFSAGKRANTVNVLELVNTNQPVHKVIC